MAAPSNTAIPVISGTPETGQTLTSDNGTWTGDPTSYTYQWQFLDVNGYYGPANEWADVPGVFSPTSSSFTIPSGFVGATLRIAVTATNGDGSATAYSSSVGPVTEPPPPPSGDPPVLGTPTISGIPADGEVLIASASATGASPISFTYSWLRSDDGSTGWVAIEGATSSTYTLNDSSLFKYIRVDVTATNSDGSDSATSEAIGPIDNAPPEAPVIGSIAIYGVPMIGTNLVSSVLSATGYPAPTFSFQWQRSEDGTTFFNISGATSDTYVPVEIDFDTFLRVEVTATNAYGSDSELSEPTLAVEVENILGLIHHSSRDNPPYPTEGLVFWDNLP